MSADCMQNVPPKCSMSSWAIFCRMELRDSSSAYNAIGEFVILTNSDEVFSLQKSSVRVTFSSVPFFSSFLGKYSISDKICVSRVTSVFMVSFASPIWSSNAISPMGCL